MCKTIDGVPRAAYLSYGLQVIARSDTLEALAVEVKHLSFTADRFRIDCICLSARSNLNLQDAICIIADAIEGAPDLDHPQRHFILIVRDRDVYLGEIQAKATRSYQKHDAKPYRTSSSLPSQLARVLVNLAYPAQTILDPCCGTGSILLEACALGLTASGMDRNPKMVGMTQRNLEHFGYQADVQLGDACQYACTADAVVTDLPYGRFLEPDEPNVRAILHQMASQVPLGIYSVDRDISPWLKEAGYQKIDVFRITKRAGFTRYIHRAHITGMQE